MKAKEKIPTAHGEVEYETVECSSCGNTVPEQSAKRYVVGTVQNIKHWGALGKREYEFDTSDYQEGWACEYCRNDGVVDFPLMSVWNARFAQWIAIVTAIAFFVGLAMGGLL